jgi:hypothetical protein
MNKRSNCLKKYKNFKRLFKISVRTLDITNTIKIRHVKIIQNPDGKKHVINNRINNKINIVDQDHNIKQM